MHLWAYLHQVEPTFKKPRPQLFIKQGYEVQALAEEYFRRQNLDIQFEVTAANSFLTARTDALVKNPNQTYSLYEVKSATHIKDKYVLDLAFQALAFKDHYALESYHLIYLNKNYHRNGALDLDQLFTTTDVTKDVLELLEDVAKWAKEAYGLYSLEKPDGLSTCGSPQNCPYESLCFPKLTTNPLYHLPRIAPDTVKELTSLGCHKLADIPDHYPLNPLQKKTVESSKTNTPIVNRENILDSLESLAYPLYFLDYEAFNFAVPRFDKTSPAQQIVFQYSLHTLPSPSGSLTHSEFLSTTTRDPTPELLNHLKDRLQLPGSVIVWYRGFEATRNREMAERFPEYQTFLEEINQSIFDLMTPFSGGDYVDYRFKGSSSIKNVLPVLCPDLSYQDLEIQEGSAAMEAWYHLVFDQVSPDEASRLEEGLFTYCHQDTFAMYRIWQELWRLVNPPDEVLKPLAI